MKDKSKIFLDLSKLTEEQIKGLVPIIEGAGDRITPFTKKQLEDGERTFNGTEFPILIFDVQWRTVSTKYEDYKRIKEITYSEFLELFGKTEQLEGKLLDFSGVSTDELISVLAHRGHFVFPKAEEGDFPDLTGFEGARMHCTYGGCESEEYVFIKYKNKYATIDCIGDTRFWNVGVHPLKQSLTYQELVEKIGLERACELAGVEFKNVEVKVK